MVVAPREPEGQPARAGNMDGRTAGAVHGRPPFPCQVEHPTNLLNWRNNQLETRTDAILQIPVEPVASRSVRCFVRWVKRAAVPVPHHTGSLRILPNCSVARFAGSHPTHRCMFSIAGQIMGIARTNVVDGSGRVPTDRA
jgi:hypothetical protein